jgi:low affinity Fe/Cu permease
MSRKLAGNGGARPNGAARPPQAPSTRPETFWKKVRGRLTRFAQSFWHKVNGYFTRFAKWSAWTTGRPGAFILAVAVVLVWLVTGPMFNFSDTWQLVINTGTTIVTFLMVFLIQNTQNRDMVALQVKLDEIIRCQTGAHNALIGLEDLTDEELEGIHATYMQLAHRAHAALKKGKPDVDSPEVKAMLTIPCPPGKPK